MKLDDIVLFLGSLRLFNRLEDDYIRSFSSLFIPLTLKKGVRLFKEGDIPDAFYLIYSGTMNISRLRLGDEEEVGTMQRGDFFGEQELMTGNANSVSMTASADTTLLKLNARNFERLINDTPEIRNDLDIIARSYRLAQRKNFKWLGADEIVHMISRKHETMLFLALVLPTFLAVAVIIALFTFLTPDTLAFYGTAIIGFGFAFFWGIWQWIDWGNDYYIVTNKRVVWLEKIVLLYDSRKEAPLNAVLSINKATNQLQRILGFGDIKIKTYTDEMILKNTAQPNQFIAAVEQYWHRAMNTTEKLRTEDISRAIRERLGMIPEDGIESAFEIEHPNLQQFDPNNENTGNDENYSQKIFLRFLKTRYEQDGVITYRKHWFLLFKRMLVFILGMGFGFVYLAARILNLVGTPSVSSLLMWFGAAVLVTSPYWIYQYADWSNDIYRVTDKHIMDLFRKPLGREEKKSAPLENILSMSVEQNFIQRIFNFGTVLINVGEEEYNFHGVHNPSAVQQELFERFYERRRELELTEAKRERDQMAEWLAIYHKEVGESDNIQNEPDLDWNPE